MGLVASDHFRIVVGLDKSDMSLVRYLACRGLPSAMVDTQENPSGLATLRAQYPQVETCCNELDTELLYSARRLYVSPSLSLHTPALVQTAAKDVRISSGIDLFACEAKVPIVTITGSNAKDTATTLVGEIAVAADKRVIVGGNLGTSAPDLLADNIELYVLELPSFQLETCDHLSAEVAATLNISEDHMDRYDGMVNYHLVKHRVFRGARQVVMNHADTLTQPLITDSVSCWSSGLNKPDFRAFGLIGEDDWKWLAFQFDKLLLVGELKIRDAHNYSNALAALALSHTVDLPFDAMPGTPKMFSGLAHRCQWVHEWQGVSYYDDSKATNVGATLAATEGPGVNIDDRLVLPAGGDGKGAGFHDLHEPVTHSYRVAVLLGCDAGLAAQTLGNTVPLMRVATLDETVRRAAELVREGDTVLLSPACAGLDMFKNLKGRGRLLVKTVEGLT